MLHVVYRIIPVFGSKDESEANQTLQQLRESEPDSEFTVLYVNDEDDMVISDDERDFEERLHNELNEYEEWKYIG